jgi:hypothetical protein
MNFQDDSALRSLDAAATSLTADEQERAEATLERIVAADPKAEVPQPTTLAPARRGWRRMVLVSATALALIVGAVVVQGIGGDKAAYASWVATPEPVTEDSLDAVASACKRQVDSYFTEWGNHPDKAKLVLAERRGEHVALLYRTENPDTSASCLARNPEGSSRVTNIETGSGGSSGPAEKAPPKGFTEGAIGESPVGNQIFSITDGAVGDEVKGVTIHAGAFTVEATVQNGRYAAWWPGPAFESGPPEPSGYGGPEPIITYDLTLEDGTVIRDAQPALPS